MKQTAKNLMPITVVSISGLLWAFLLVNSPLSLRAFLATHSGFNLPYPNVCLTCANIFGLLFGGYLADRIGRKPVLLWSNVLLFLSMVSYVLWYQHSIAMPLILLQKCLVSVALITALVYVVEVAATARRGRSIVWFKLWIVAGTLLALLSHHHGVDSTNYPWQAASLCAVALSGVGAIALFFVAESSVWLSAQQTVPRVASWGGLFHRPVRRTTLWVALICFVTTLTCINCFINYNPGSFEEVKLLTHGTSALLGTVQGFVYGFGLICSLWIIDRIDLRAVLLLSLGGIIISYIVFSIASSFLLGNIGVYIILLLRPMFFAFFYGLGAPLVVNIVMSAFFPTLLRVKGAALAVSLLVLIEVIPQTILSIVRHHFNINAFYWFSTVMTLLLLLICLNVLPDSTRKPLNQLKLIRG